MASGNNSRINQNCGSTSGSDQQCRIKSRLTIVRGISAKSGIQAGNSVAASECYLGGFQRAKGCGHRVADLILKVAGQQVEELMKR